MCRSPESSLGTNSTGLEIDARNGRIARIRAIEAGASIYAEESEWNIPYLKGFQLF